MTFFTKNEPEIFTSVPTWPCEWPEVVVCDSMAAPGSGTSANPIVIGDDLAPLGSASNPIVIQVDEGWCQDEPDQLGSDDDTEIMATPEFWEALIDESFSVPPDEREAVGSPSVYEPTRLPANENLEALHSLEQSSATIFCLDDKVLKMTESHFKGLENYSGLEAIMRENVANGQANCEQSMERGKISQAEKPSEVPEISSTTRGACTQETNDQNGTSDEKNMTFGPHAARSTDSKLSHADTITHETTDQAGSSDENDLSCLSLALKSTKRRLSPGNGVYSELRRSERLARRART